MEKWIKILNKRVRKDQIALTRVIKLIISQELSNLDVKKLKGHDNIFRVRVRNFRIIFKKDKNTNFIIKINERGD